MRTLCLTAFFLSPLVLTGKTELITMPGASPIVTFRIVFRSGAAFDPPGKPGVAALTAAMLAEGGTRQMTYKELLDAMFPMATSVSHQVDKEMITFSAATHTDNLGTFYGLLRSMLLDPGWRADDLERLRDDAINFLRVSLRGNNEEELGKEALYGEIFAGTPYAHHNVGAVSALRAITMQDLQEFYRRHFTQANLVIGLAGGYPPGFPERVRKDFAKLPPGTETALRMEAPKAPAGTRVLLIEKPTRSVAISIGHPIEVRRGHPDFLPLLVAQSYFGQHRMSGGRLYERMRQVRGLNYGDYAYLEYFPRGMFQLEPDPNLARRQQIFQIWIRPVEPPTAHFALRLALWELDRLIAQGLTEEDFQRTRSFLSKYVNLLTKTKRAELGYAIDSLYYGIPNYTEYVRRGLAKLTRADVNRAIRKHLRTQDLHIVAVGAGMQEFRRKLLANEPSPMTYNSPKPEEVLKEDKLVESWKIELKPDNVRIVPVDSVFEEVGPRAGR